MKRLTSIKKWHILGLLGVLALGIVVVTAIAVSLVSNDLSAHGGDTSLVHACVNQTNARSGLLTPARVMRTPIVPHWAWTGVMWTGASMAHQVSFQSRVVWRVSTSRGLMPKAT